jgi:UPF0755 protein
VSRKRPRLKLPRARLLALAAAVLAVAAVLWTYNGPGPAAMPTTVILERGSGVRAIAAALKQAGVISSTTVFMVVARTSGAAGELKAGEYAFRAGEPMRQVLEDIRAGRVVRRMVTIPEGWTSGMVVDALLAQPALAGPVEEPPEGSILPDTYQFQRGETREAVAARMRAARDKLVAELWAGRAQGLPFATPEEAVTLASVVEKETGVPAERPRVAAVFINRLRAGMPLQSDPTVIYAVSRGRPLGRGLTVSELALASPYNTYVHARLPPTPIATPGRAALEAVLNPPKTDEIYFVADGTGGHAFAATLAQHEQNVARWRAIERARAAEAQGGR